MFAILFSKTMDPFYEIFLSFPTIIFSGLLLLSVLFGVIAVLGMVDFDFLNIDFSSADGLDSSNDALSNTHVLAGLAMHLGLAGIPGPLIFFFVSLFGWMLSFITSFYIYDYIPDGIVQIILGLVIFLLCLYVAAYFTGFLMRPFKSVFSATMNEVEKNSIGLVGIVRSSQITSTAGTIDVNDGGAGLILNARSYDDLIFNKGDRVVLLEYIEEGNYYKVISEKEFNEK